MIGGNGERGETDLICAVLHYFCVSFQLNYVDLLDIIIISHKSKKCNSIGRIFL